MNLYVVRHGQTDWNTKELVQGSTNIELNLTGIKQANEVAEQLKDINFSAIYSSPLNRAFDTAEIINQYHNLNIIKDNRIIERCFGIFEGTNKLKNNLDYWDYNSNLSTNNVESVHALFKRVNEFLHELYNKYQDTNSNVLVVTHGATGIAINAVINNLTTNLSSFGMKNCEFKVFKNLKLDIKKEN